MVDSPMYDRLMRLVAAIEAARADGTGTPVSMTTGADGLATFNHLAQGCGYGGKGAARRRHGCLWCCFLGRGGGAEPAGGSLNGS